MDRDKLGGWLSMATVVLISTGLMLDCTWAGVVGLVIGTAMVVALTHKGSR